MADKRWIGAALDINDIWTITIAGVWAAADTITVSVGNSSMVLTIGPEITTGEVAIALSAAINAVDSTDGIVGGESRNVGGRQMPELLNVDATVASNTVTLTNSIAGEPFTLVVTETTAGTGTATEANSQVATGKHFADNAENWEGGVLPVQDDVLVFDTGQIDCLYGLDYFLTNTLETGFLRTTDYQGEIGLPEFNDGGYMEYRTRYLSLFNGTADKEIIFNPGDSGGRGGVTRLNLDGQLYSKIIILDLGPVGPSPSLEISGGKAEFVMSKGYVSIDPPDQLPAAPFIFSATSTAYVGGSSLDDSETLLQIGEGLHTDTFAVFRMYSGSVESRATIYDAAGPMTIELFGGTFRQLTDGDIWSVIVRGGALFEWRGDGTARGSDFDIWTNGTMDVSKAPNTQTYNYGITMYGNSTLFINDQTVVVFAFEGCRRSEVTIIETNG